MEEWSTNILCSYGEESSGKAFLQGLTRCVEIALYHAMVAALELKFDGVTDCGICVVWEEGKTTAGITNIHNLSDSSYAVDKTQKCEGVDTRRQHFAQREKD